MSISFHISAVREGTIFNVMQFLSLERVTGTLSISFGPKLPAVAIYFVTGNVTAAEFGSIVGDAVLDLLLCQEYAVKEIAFTPGRIAKINEESIIVRAQSLSAVMLNVSRDVDQCESRPFIYGLLPTGHKQSTNAMPLLQIFHEFTAFNTALSAIPAVEGDKAAPLPQCVYLHRAFARGILHYDTELVPIKALLPLLGMLKPLTEKESSNLRGYLKSLLPHSRATHIPLDRFYAFASAIESIAQRRSAETGDKVRSAIQKVLQAASGKPLPVSTHVGHGKIP